jgi:hypothetical protein
MDDDQQLSPLLYNASLSSPKSAELSEWLAIKASLERYRKEDFSQLSGELFIISTIWTDGVGDYITLLRTASLMKRYYPNVSVQVVFHHKQNLPKIDFTKEFGLDPADIHAFKETDNPLTQVLQPILEGKTAPLPFEIEYEKLQREIHQDREGQLERERKGLSRSPALDVCIEEAEEDAAKLYPYFALKEKALQIRKSFSSCIAIIHIALAIDTFSDKTLRAKSFYFSESGNFQGIEKSLEYHWFSLGLLPFEEGFFLIKDVPSTNAVVEALYKRFQTVSESHYVGYFSPFPTETVALFIYLICHYQEEGDITIFLPFDEENLQDLWPKLQTIGKVIFATKEEQKEFVIAGNSRTLTLINCFPLELSDYAFLCKNSQNILGCTGDSSLGECLGLGKIPFYQTRRHKVETVQSFIALATIYFGKEAALTRYFAILEALDLPNSNQLALIEQLARCLKEPTFYNNWQMLLKEIHQYYDLENNLLGRFQRYLALQIYS